MTVVTHCLTYTSTNTVGTDLTVRRPENPVADERHAHPRDTLLAGGAGYANVRFPIVVLTPIAYNLAELHAEVHVRGIGIVFSRYVCFAIVPEERVF